MRASTTFLILLSGAPFLRAQDATDTPAVSASISPATAPDDANDSTAIIPADPGQAGSDAEAGRIFGVIPDNKIVPSSKTNEEPLTTRAKFNLAWRDTIDPFTFVLAGFYAGLAQWDNDYKTWGQGASGYGQRIGAAYADQAIGNYFTEAIIPSLTHEDPRYFRKGTGKGWSRMTYALTRTVITRTDRGRSQFNYSEWVGNTIAAGISNLYYPAADRTANETFEKLGIQIVSDSAFNVLLEFWPDMKRMVLHH